jgi:hypothetical protein
LNKEKATTCCITPKHFVVQINNTLYFSEVKKDKLGSLKDKKTIEDLERMKNVYVFNKIIELDNGINYIIPVSPNSLSLFPEIDCTHDFIQFETGSKVDKSDLAFIWDLNTNEPVETLD